MANNWFNQFWQSVFSLQVWGLAKGLIVFFLLLYVGFAVVVIRQVNLMKKALNGALDLPLTLIAWLHFGFALVVLLIALTSL